MAGSPGPGTKLTAWFTLNAESEEGRQLFYVDVVSHHKFVARTRTWVRTRTPRRTVGRMAAVENSVQETFYLPMLLSNRMVCASFEDVRTVRSVLHETFRAACTTLGLVEDDGDLHRTLAVLEPVSSGRQLRRMFAIILRECSPLDPHALWVRLPTRWPVTFANPTTSCAKNDSELHSLIWTHWWHLLAGICQSAVYPSRGPLCSNQTTGIAATQLFNDETAHRAFFIPARNQATGATTSNVRLQSNEAKMLSQLRFII